MLRKAMLQVKDWGYLCQKCSDFVLLLHWKPKQVLTSTFPLWRFDLFLDVGGQGAKALGGQKTQTEENKGEGKKGK